MLDDESNEITLDESAAPPARKRARKAPAAPAPPDQAAGTAPKKAAKKAAKKATAKQSPAKRTSKKAAPAPEPAGESADAPPVAVVDAPGRKVIPVPLFQEPVAVAPITRKRATKPSAAVESEPEVAEITDAAADDEPDEAVDGGVTPAARRRRRGGRGRRRKGEVETADDEAEVSDALDAGESATDDEDESTDETEGDGPRRRRRRRRGAGTEGSDEPRARETRDVPSSVRGSTRLEAKKQRRREGREAGRRRTPILSEAEFLARRESVDRVMVVRQEGDRTQIAVLEDGVLVEHYVNRAGSASMAGNVYLGRVQNVLPSMEAAFVDIGRGRNAVLYAGEVNWDAAGLEGQPRRIELALKSGDPVLVQVTKDPVGHKGARLTSQISLPGRYLVYVPEGSMTGISRKLPDIERNRLKNLLRDLVSEDAGVIVRTAAEGASEEELTSDVQRLATQWEDIKTKSATANAPALLHGEPDVAIRVVRDIFNEDFNKLIVAGAGVFETISDYVSGVAPDLADRIEKWVGSGDMFGSFRIDEQLAKALDRKVWLPSGGSLVIDRTEAMTVIDVNTGKFTGQGGNLEETVTRNNVEAAEEIVRQLRLRDVGGIIVIDFIDMVLESNRDLVLRRLTECLGRDRTKHQVAEVTSLGLVQMTRKRIGQSLLDVFSEPCEHCNGRGLKILSQPVVSSGGADEDVRSRRSRPAPLIQVKTGLDPVDALRAHSHHDEDGEPTDVTATAELEADTDQVPSRTPSNRRSRGGRKSGRVAAADESNSGGSSPDQIDVVHNTAAVADAQAAPGPADTPVAPAPAAGESVAGSAGESAPVPPRGRRPRRATTAGPVSADPNLGAVDQ